MAAPTFVIAGGGSSASFASSITTTLDVGSGTDRTILVEVVATGGASASVVTGITVGGVALTLTSDESLLTQMGSAGRFRGGHLQGEAIPSGSQAVVATMSDGNSKLTMIVTVYSGTTAVSSATLRAGSTSYTPTASAAAGANEMVAWMALTSAIIGTQSIAATSPSVVRRDETSGGSAWLRMVSVDRIGVGGATAAGYTVTGGASPGHSGHYWVLTGSADPSDLSGGPTADPVVAAGSMGSSASDLAGDAALASVAVAGTLGQQPGVLTLGPVHQPLTGLRADGVTLPWVAVQRLSDGVQVAVLTGQTVNGSGMLVLTHGAIVPGVDYAGLLYTGSVVGCGRATAA